MPGCSFEDCGNKHFAKGLCHGHYTQQWKGYELRALHHRNLGAECSFDGCHYPARSKGLCKGHYRQQYNGKDLRPLSKGRHENKPLPNEITRGPATSLLHCTKRDGSTAGDALLDNADVDVTLVRGRWGVNPHGYVFIRNKDKTVTLLHRFLMGDACMGHHVDHINGDRLDHRRVNLRVITPAQNSQNVVRPQRPGYMRNVCWSESRGRWRVQASLGGKRYSGGDHIKLEDAIEAARVLREEIFTHHNEERHKD